MVKTYYEVRYLLNDSTSARFCTDTTKAKAVKRAKFLSKGQNNRFYYVNKITSECIFHAGKI